MAIEKCEWFCGLLIHFITNTNTNSTQQHAKYDNDQTNKKIKKSIKFVEFIVRD